MMNDKISQLSDTALNLLFDRAARGLEFPDPVRKAILAERALRTRDRAARKEKPPTP